MIDHNIRNEQDSSITLTQVVKVIKLFFDDWVKQATVFVPGKPFQSVSNICGKDYEPVLEWSRVGTHLFVLVTNIRLGGKDFPGLEAF